ncbi:MAG TPA: TorF family putative porin [Gammaproteobacteria bacterium]
MNKSMKTVVAASVLAAVMGSSAAMAGASANVGATSNYVWRGITQSADGAAVSGGLDYSHDSGLYVGTWTSSTAWSSSEVDLYGGYATTLGGVSLDVGLTRYAYPTNSLLNWTEVKVAAGFGPAKVTVARGDSVFGYTDVNSTYAALDLSHTLKDDLSVGLHAGYWKFSEAINPSIVTNGFTVGTDEADTMAEYGVSLTKGEFTFTVSDSNLDKDIYTQDGQYRVYASFTRKFDL